jgi:hypothetical protein
MDPPDRLRRTPKVVGGRKRSGGSDLGVGTAGTLFRFKPALRAFCHEPTRWVPYRYLFKVRGLTMSRNDLTKGGSNI